MSQPTAGGGSAPRAEGEMLPAIMAKQIHYDVEALYAPALYGLVFSNDHRSLDVLKTWNLVPPAVQLQCFEVDPREVNYEFARQCYSYSSKTPAGEGGAHPTAKLTYDADGRTVVGQQHAADGLKRSHGYIRAMLDRFYLDKLQADCAKLIKTSLFMKADKVSFETILKGQCDKKQSNPIDPPQSHPEVQQLYNLDGGPGDNPCITYGTTCGKHGELFYFTRRKPSEADREKHHWFEVKTSVMQASALAHFLWTSVHMSWIRVLRCCSYFDKALSKGLTIPRQEARTLAPGDYGVASALGREDDGKPTGLKIHSTHPSWSGGTRRRPKADGLGPVGGMLRAIENGGLANAVANAQQQQQGLAPGGYLHSNSKPSLEGAIDEEPEPGVVGIGGGGLVPLPRSALGTTLVRDENGADVQALNPPPGHGNKQRRVESAKGPPKAGTMPHENPQAKAILADSKRKHHLNNVNQLMVRVPKALLQKESFHQLTTHANFLKGAGNQCYKAGRYEEACALYTRGLAVLPPGACKVRCLLLSNRSACYLRLGRYWLARFDCSKVIDVNPRYVKSAFRRAVASALLGDHQAAMCDLYGLIEIVSSDVPQEILVFINWLVQSAPPGTCHVAKSLAEKVVHWELDRLKEKGLLPAVAAGGTPQQLTSGPHRQTFNGTGCGNPICKNPQCGGGPDERSLARRDPMGEGGYADPVALLTDQVERDQRKRLEERLERVSHFRATAGGRKPGARSGEEILKLMDTEQKKALQQYLMDYNEEIKKQQQKARKEQYENEKAGMSTDGDSTFVRKVGDTSWLDYYDSLADQSGAKLGKPKKGAGGGSNQGPTPQEVAERERVAAMEALMLEEEERPTKKGGKGGKGGGSNTGGGKGGKTSGKQNNASYGGGKSGGNANTNASANNTASASPTTSQDPGALGQVVKYTTTQKPAAAPMEYHPPAGPVIPLDLMWDMD